MMDSDIDMKSLTPEQALGVVESAAAGRDHAIREKMDADEVLKDAIRNAYSIPGVTVIQIARAAQVSRQRIYAICGGKLS